jgi:hypothetical protein
MKEDLARVTVCNSDSLQQWQLATVTADNSNSLQDIYFATLTVSASDSPEMSKFVSVYIFDRCKFCPIAHDTLHYFQFARVQT